MIQSKEDYLFYLEADRLARGRKYWNRNWHWYHDSRMRRGLFNDYCERQSTTGIAGGQSSMFVIVNYWDINS